VNWFVYGLICVTVGIVQMYRKAKRPMHSPRCAKCGATWIHRSDVDYGTARAAVDAHTCPKCGAEQFEIDGHHALRTDAPPVAAAPAAAPATPTAPAAQLAPAKKDPA
jgi:predicted RNA-binding Zn-ribbon protein involved in translation (DUF1610 family)